MDFTRVLGILDAFFAGQNTRWVLIGGLAMAAHGLPRTTSDVDLAVDGDTQDRLVAFLEASSYRTLHRSPGYSNHLHADSELGRVDVVYLRGATRDTVFAAARPVPGPGGRPVLVASPEHLAAMKVFAMRNDPARTRGELEDIRYLLTLPDVDRAEIERSFLKHGMEARFREIAPLD